MKTNNSSKTAAILALAGIIHATGVYAEGHSFTPIEQLNPEQRKEISEKLKVLSSNLNIDWEEIVIGVNERGQITFRNVEDVRMRVIAGHSCMDSSVGGDIEK